MKEARYYRQLPGRFVECELCPKACRIAEGRTGACLGRRNRDGRLYAESYGQLVSLAMDPIEKKPLYHFHPGARILSIATYGCNLSCPFCQNSEISGQRQPGQDVTPEQVVATARRECSLGVAYTYTEPLVWFEFLMDACPQVRAAGMVNVLVTNGMLNQAPLRELLPYIDALNIDLKSIRPEFYRDFVGGDLGTVKRSIARCRERCHVELTNLVIPGRNDSEAEFRELTGFVAGLGRDTVLHLSRYFPHHRLDLPPTPVETLETAYRIARERLDYVYLGNVGESAQSSDTLCPQCGNLLVKRRNFSARVTGVEQGSCGKCGRRADLVL